MIPSPRTLLLAIACFSAVHHIDAAQKSLSLHPDNAHYFLFRGRPTVLVTSGEHYGAVLNLDFDYVTYLEALRGDGLNLTRTFTGAYVEPAGAFNIASNTLAPAPNRFISPWARSDAPGYAHGGNKFDLTRWNAAYFDRLKDFVHQASKRGVIVELNLFCPFYEEPQWKISPQNPANNINPLTISGRTNVYTLDRHGGLLAVHEALVKKIVRELKDFDNVYYEICNEPYFGGVTVEWQHRIADVIQETERTLAAERALPRGPHLISQNIANGRSRIRAPHPGVSIFNFHYATPPDTVALNYDLNKAIGDNETGFKGTNDTAYRIEGWEFMLAGGALYNNLDYSFVARGERGDFQYTSKQPGGGSPALRRQLGILKKFLEELDFLHAKPDTTFIKGGLAEKSRAHALVEPGKQYALYIVGGVHSNLSLELPAGNYRVEWMDPLTGRSLKRDRQKHPGGVASISTPASAPEMVLRILR